MIITKESIQKTTDTFRPKAFICLVDEMSEVMNSTNFKLVSSIQNNIGSIARLGRAAACHLVLATQRPSSNVINADLKNNIQCGVLLGDFDASASTLIFDEDISARSKPEIKGRGYIKSGKEITEFQSFWTEKEKDFVKKDLSKAPKLPDAPKREPKKKGDDDLGGFVSRGGRRQPSRDDMVRDMERMRRDAGIDTASRKEAPRQARDEVVPRRPVITGDDSFNPDDHLHARQVKPELTVEAVKPVVKVDGEVKVGAAVDAAVEPHIEQQLKKSVAVEVPVMHDAVEQPLHAVAHEQPLKPAMGGEQPVSGPKMTLKISHGKDGDEVAVGGAEVPLQPAGEAAPKMKIRLNHGGGGNGAKV